MQETLVLSLGQEEPLKKEMAIHSCILAWKVPYTEELGRLQFMGSQRVRHNWVTEYARINRNSKTCLKWLLWGAEIQRGEMGWVLLIFIIHVVILGFSGGSDSKEYAYNCGRPGFHPWFQKYPGEGHGNQLQYSCLENSMDRGDWWATVYGIAKSQTWLSE